MDFIKGNFYLLTIDSTKQLVFACQILEETDCFLTFKDKYGKIYTYNKTKIISYKKLDNLSNESHLH